jgi:hypothetical protein
MQLLLFNMLLPLLLLKMSAKLMQQQSQEQVLTRQLHPALQH